MKSSDFPLIRDSASSYRNVLGHRFGKLVVASREIQKHNSDGRHKHWWRCICDCGNERYVHFDALIRKHTVSCGCVNAYQNKICPAFKAIIIDHRVNTNKSASQIGIYFGITKNSVMGILDRADMCTSKTPVPLARNREDIWFPPHNQCVYPNGTPGIPGFAWCCEPVKDGSSFCPEHHARCYIDETTAKKLSLIKETQTLSKKVA